MGPGLLSVTRCFFLFVVLFIFQFCGISVPSEWNYVELKRSDLD